MDNSRRKFLQVVAGGVVVGGGLGFAGIASGKGDITRPPGAIVEADFLARCQRCMRCVDACQPAALLVGHLSDGFANIGTPILVVNKCIQCMECVRACPSGALSKVDKKDLRMGLAVIDQKTCAAYNKKRCRACVDACREAKAITLKDRRYPVVDPEKCTGCGACLKRCPEIKKGAIAIDTSKVKRFDPPQDRILAKLEDNSGEASKVPFGEWLGKRLETLGQLYGLKK